MAIVFVNGFDDQIHSASPVGTWNAAFDTTVFRTGSTSLRATATNLAGANLGLLAIPGGGDATVILGSAILSTVSSAQVGWFFLSDNGATMHVTVTLNLSTGVLTVFRGTSAGTSLGTVTLSGSAILSNVWGYWEIKVVLSDTVGEVHVRYNGTAVLDLTGVDTKNAGTKTVLDSIGYPQGTSASSNQCYVDDLYLVTGTGAPNNFLGDCKVSTIYPDGNGAFSQMVGSDADSVNNYLLVNEAGAPVTTTYTESDTVGVRDFYTMGDIGIPSNATVLAVQVSAYCNNPDAGAARSAKLGVRQGTSETLSANQALTAATFLPARGMFTTDPATGAAWTVAGVNTMQAGVEVG